MAVKKVDLCIVGGSAAGMSAAIIAKRKGVKDVLILEKMNATGGTARMTDGIMAIGSQTQRDLGLYYDIDQFFKDVITLQDWHCDAKLVRKWLNGTAASMDLLESIGMHYGLAVTETSDINRFRRTRHVPVEFKDGKLTKLHQGPILVRKMLEACQKEGVEIICNCRAEHLIQRDDGTVTGVKAVMKEGEMLEVEAKAVILATGSISHNRELVKELYEVEQYGDPDFLIAADMPWNTGDGYYMAREVGGGKGRVAAYYMGPHNHFDGYSEIICCLVRRGHNIQVNRNGERFCDEALMTESEWGWMKGAALDCQPGRVCYTIMDEAMLRRLENGEEYIPFNLTPAYIDQPMMRPGSYYEKDFDPQKWRTYIRNHLIHDEQAGGRVAICNTVAEMARFIGCDEATLQETLENYNRFCALKHDEEFLKDPKYLHPVVEAPFYVMRGDHCIDTAIGGVTIDHRQRVVTEEGKHIPGLYAAGVMCSGWSNGQYVINCAAMSFTVYSGCAAGEEASELLLGKNA